MHCTPGWSRFCLYFRGFFTNSLTFVGKKLLWKHVVCVASSSHPVVNWQPVQGMCCHSVTAGPRRPGGNELKSVQPAKLMVKPLSVSCTLLELDARSRSCVSSWEKSRQGFLLVWGNPPHCGATMLWALTSWELHENIQFQQIAAPPCFRSCWRFQELFLPPYWIIINQSIGTSSLIKWVLCR